jgi:hypothetical protein
VSVTALSFCCSMFEGATPKQCLTMGLPAEPGRALPRLTGF